ncbi:DNA processing protein DprA [Methylobacterium sp. V23]|nr:DNA processing protein DprA [Methylobacterium sp. V23]
MRTIGLPTLLEQVHRPALEPKQLDFLSSAKQSGIATIYYSGDLGVLNQRAVSIVGTREVSDEGRRRARKLARELVAAGVTVVSGLAKGVDTAALSAALEVGGRTAAVIGTPLDKAYPAENASLQEQIYGEHLLLTPFAIGEATFRGNFPKRNRVMAAVSDATVIVEASDTSGTLHQAAECGRLGRWLFIMRSVADDQSLSWPRKFIDKPKVAVISSTQEILDAIEK